jgi:hypothetical protein
VEWIGSCQVEKAAQAWPTIALYVLYSEETIEFEKETSPVTSRCVPEDGVGFLALAAFLALVAAGVGIAFSDGLEGG